MHRSSRSLILGDLQGVPRLAACGLLIGGLLLASLLIVQADDYPSRPIKLLVGASPGGTTDTMARAIALPSRHHWDKEIYLITGGGRATGFQHSPGAIVPSHRGS
jgi:putative tricarboxylic transport membrane protein